MTTHEKPAAPEKPAHAPAAHAMHADPAEPAAPVANPEHDKLALDVANHLHSLPRPARQTGGATVTHDLAEPKALAALFRPTLTDESVAAAKVGGKFNIQKFLENLSKIYTSIAPLIGIISTFSGHPIVLPPLPPITPSVPPAGQPST